MNRDLVETRVDQLMASPGGCMFLVLAEFNGMDGRALSDPRTILPLVSMAVGEMIPWVGAHDEIVRLARAGAAGLRSYATQLLTDADIDFMWAPLDRDRQVWIQPEWLPVFPTSSTFTVPTGPPSRHSFYIHQPDHPVQTSTELSGTTSQYESLIGGATDWKFDYVAQRMHVTVAPSARIREIDSAQDWHDFVIEYGVQAAPGVTYHPRLIDRPWGAHDGLVPDWSRVAADWDGVHITPWAYLTATQVRVTSTAGWTEPWAWEYEHTTWLRWVFRSVEELTPIAMPAERPVIGLPHEFWNNPYTPLGQYRPPF
jgi:hypothetical protein